MHLHNIFHMCELSCRSCHHTRPPLINKGVTHFHNIQEYQPSLPSTPGHRPDLTTGSAGQGSRGAAANGDRANAGLPRASGVGGDPGRLLESPEETGFGGAPLPLAGTQPLRLPSERIGTFSFAEKHPGKPSVSCSLFGMLEPLQLDRQSSSATAVPTH